MTFFRRLRRWRLGLRNEAVILVPLVLLLLIVLSMVSLFRGHAMLDSWLQREQATAEVAAKRLAAEFTSAQRVPRAGELRAGLPEARGIVVFSATGEILTLVGEIVPTPASEPRPWWRPARLAGGRRLRVDLPAEELSRKLRSQGIVAPVIIVADVAAVLLVIVFLPYWLAPLDSLIERARQAGQAIPEGDEVAGLLGVFDRALGALGDSSNELAALERTVAKSLESGVLLIDRDGVVLSLNRAGASLLGLDDPTSGTSVHDLLATHPSLLEPLLDVIETERSIQRAEIEIEIDLDDRRTIGFTAHPLRYDNGPPRGFLVLFADLTESRRRDQKERLSENLTQLGELTAGLAHELRNGVATVRGYLQLLDREHTGALHPYLVEIHHETDHLTRVLEDFLSFARPGSLRSAPFDLVSLVRRVAADPSLHAVEIHVTVETGDSQDALWVEGDAQLLERALRNLVHNAVLATTEIDGTTPVEVRLSARADETIIEVLDRGPGVPATVAERLFEPFATSRAGGVGLGLAIARRIVLLHGGSVSIEPRGSGGTRAIFALPVLSVTDGNNEAGAR
ncbi:MAG: ATP-binding protein [Acidobacteriota bacterium]